MAISEVNYPEDLKKLSIKELEELSIQIREFLNTKQYGKSGHIKASMGVTELSIALHYTFNTPKDILVWDVGHQAYIHKLLTGRRNQFPQKRKRGGISGFTNRAESEFDAFGAGHSSTSISAVCGFAEVALLEKIKRKHIAVIGDGAFTGGMSFEALNYAGERNLDVFVILNDNQTSIDENVGALNRYSSYAQFCESLNFDFLGEVDGHNLPELLETISAAAAKKGPRLLRVKTEKGKGYKNPVKESVKTGPATFQQVVAENLLELFRKNEKVVLISPAMLSGGQFLELKQQFPTRVFDVGIAEQHAVTMAAGMAASGYRPLVHLYSTFSQRAADQIIHDVALQNLPVTFLLDRAGFVGEDGATHHGVFDVSIFSAVPNVVVNAPSDAKAMRAALANSLNAEGPLLIRYPKDSVPKNFNGLDFYRKGEQKLVVSYGSISAQVMAATEELNYGHLVLQQIKPVDFERITPRLKDYKKVVVVEESLKGFGLAAIIRQHFSEHDIAMPCKSVGLADIFVEHGTRAELLESSGLVGENLSRALLTA